MVSGSGGASNGSGGSGATAGTSGTGGTAGSNGTGGSIGTGGAPSATGGSSGTGGAPDGTGGNGGTGGTGTGGAAGACGAFAPVADLASNGPLTTMNAAEGTNCQIYRPTTLGGGGVKHPVILWGNGTAGPTLVYAAAFDYWASHGFIVAAGNSSNGQGSGAEMLGCLDYVTKQNSTPGSPYEGKVCTSRVGASGHSQGGGGALMAGQDPRLTVTAPLMPYIAQGFGGFDTASITKQHGPMLLLSGTADTIAPPATNQQPVFDTTNVPVFWANLVGGDHVAVSLNGLTTYKNAMLAWYRLHLMGDESFRKMFYGPSCTLCVDSAWQVQRKGIN
jgi:predicted dienelactone hydrolase